MRSKLIDGYAAMMLAALASPLFVEPDAAHVTLRRFAGLLSAGFPSAAEGFEDDPLNLHAYLVRNDAATIMARLSGDALAETEHLVDGTIMVVDQSRKERVGDLVMAEYQGRRIFVRLRQGMRVVVRGVVVGAARRV